MVVEFCVMAPWIALAAGLAWWMFSGDECRSYGGVPTRTHGRIVCDFPSDGGEQ